MAETTNSEQYSLIFEGPKDDSTKTLQRIKGVFVADLEFPISDVQRFLESTPVTVKTADNAAELEHAYNMLKAAGAKVLLVKPRREEAETPPPSAEAAEPSSGETVEIEFELEPAPGKKQASAPKVYSLSLDDGGDAPLAQFAENYAEKDELAAKATPEGSPGATPSKTSSSTDPLAGLLAGQSDAPAESGEKGLGADHSQILTLELEESPSATPAEKNSVQGLPVKPSRTTEADTPDFNSLSLQLADAPEETHVPTQASKVAEQERQLEEPPEILFSVNEDKPRTDDSLTLEAAQELKALEAEPASPPSSPALSKPPPAPPVMTLDEQAATPPPSLPPIAKQAAQTAENDPAQSEQKDQPAIFAPVSPDIEAPPARKTSRLPLDIAIPIIVGSLILGAANLYYFSPTLGSSANIDALVASVSPADESETPAVANTATVTQVVFTAIARTELYEIEVAVRSSEGKPTEARINITTPEPRTQTKEEIVNGIPRAPWLKRIIVSGLNPRLVDGASYTAEGLAIAYVDDNKNQIRVPGNATLTLNWSDSPTAELSIVSKETPEDKNADFSFARASDGRFNYQAHLTFNLAKQQ